MNVTGLDDLDSISFDWKTVKPGMLSGKCCATGTCDNGSRTTNSTINFIQIPNETDQQCAWTLKDRLGNLRKAA